MSETYDILVIDDSATIRKLIDMTMRGTAFRAHFSASAMDGINLARQLRPHAILLDCVLPDASAVHVCKQLTLEERTRAIPIVLVSAKADKVRDDFREYPAVVDFVSKPFTGPDLLRRIQRVVAPASPPSPFDRDQQERAAKILYARLRDNLALVPALVKQIGTSPPAPFLAKRLLTPEIVGSILEDLAELIHELHADHERSQALEPMPPSAVVDRVSGFSKRVRDIRLGSTSRRVLTLVNGEHSVDDIARRIGLDVRTVGVTIRDLVDHGLLEHRLVAPARPVVILEPDVNGFQRPLASLLEARPEAPALVAISNVAEIVTTVRRIHPCLVVVNATGESSSFGDAARTLRADGELSDVALVAVLDRCQQSERDDLYSAGFDAVLSKPIIFSELERFIAPAGASQRKEEPWIRS